MRVKVIRKFADSIYGFRSSIGLFQGIWIGESILDVGEEIDVELELEDIIFQKIVENGNYIVTRNGYTFIAGRVEDEEDDIYYLRLDKDLIMLDKIQKGLNNKIIEFQVNSIKVFPY